MTDVSQVADRRTADDRQTRGRGEAGERQMRDRRHVPDTEIQADDRRTIHKRRTDERPKIYRK